MPTIGVAVAIPEPWASELQDYRMALGDRTATMIPTHITLVPPIEVRDGLDAIEQHLESTAAHSSRFAVQLRGTDSFRPISPVVFVRLVEGAAACTRLADSVRSGPLTTELTYPYHPHVTIAHHLRDEQLDRACHDLADFECRFDVTDFHLYVHDEDLGWQPTRDFALQVDRDR